MRTARTALLCGILVAAAVPAAANASPKPATTVSVTESEMIVTSSATQARAGKVTFVVRNTGTVEHELVIVRSLGQGKLPVTKWKVDETKIKVGEVPELAPGKIGRVTLALSPGNYLMICNIPGHYQLGMFRKLTVR
jgi:uncharacterized cupredoxin-like copper-binding protein